METIAHTLENPRLLLQQELNQRCSNNPSYSLRAFGKALGISHTVLSLVLNNKRPLSAKAYLRVMDRLGIPPEERAKRMQLYSAKRKHQQFSSKQDEFTQISLDTFSLLADWEHMAILSLLEISGFNFTAEAISTRLGISHSRAKLAMERLLRLELVRYIPNRGFKQSVKPIKVENTVSTVATRNHHKQLLGKALFSLENHPMSLRDFSAITFAMDPHSVSIALQEIRRFRRRFSKKLEKIGTPTEVYTMSVQLFPLSQIQEHTNVKN